MKWYEKLLYWGFCSNYWGWFHALSGTLIAKVANHFLAAGWSILITFVIAVIWEIIEFRIECSGSWSEVEKIYGTKGKYLYDSVGDVLLALIFAIIVVV